MKKILIVLAMALFFVSQASADVINTGRPITPFKDFVWDLQDVFNSIRVAPTPSIDAVNGQSNVAVWQSQASGGSIATFIFTDIGDSGDIVGMYSYADNTKMLPIFPGDSLSGAQVMISFFADGSVKNLMTSQTIAGFGNVFGFYFDNNGGIVDIAYTEDSLNGGIPLALTYQGTGTNRIQIGALAPGYFVAEEWIIAFDGYPHGTGQYDYNDAVFLVESIERASVPEPGILILLGIGLGAVGLFSRRIKL